VYNWNSLSNRIKEDITWLKKLNYLVNEEMGDFRTDSDCVFPNLYVDNLHMALVAFKKLIPKTAIRYDSAKDMWYVGHSKHRYLQIAICLEIAAPEPIRVPTT
jgi:hypothetical protein